MKERLEQIKAEATALIQAADVPEKLNDVRVRFLGKKGELTAVLKGMKDVAPEDRPKVGQLVNDARAAIEELIDEYKTKMEKAIREQKMKEEVIDVTLPSKKNIMGHRHPNNIVLEEVERIFVGMGYEVVEGPEVEYDEYNFTKLNIPADHPAKDEQDTFYINKDIVLRTQTSPVQARVMEQGKMLQAIPNGLVDATSIVSLVLMYGGAFGIINSTRVIECGIASSIEKMRRFPA